MGTVFNNNVFVYDKILKAFAKIMDQNHTFRVIVSVGEANLKTYERRIKSEGYELPRNLYLFARVPQIEVLKRASLFVTHAGMNSTSEAIEWAVPLVCVPLQADQPIVAKRVCRELRLGVDLDPVRFIRITNNRLNISYFLSCIIIFVVFCKAHVDARRCHSSCG